MELTPYQLLGSLFLILGVLFFVMPFLLKIIPSIENIPWIILYVYKREGFVFVTSPILIIISIVSIFLNFFFQK